MCCRAPSSASTCPCVGCLAPGRAGPRLGALLLTARTAASCGGTGLPRLASPHGAAPGPVAPRVAAGAARCGVRGKARGAARPLPLQGGVWVRGGGGGRRAQARPAPGSSPAGRAGAARRSGAERSGRAEVSGRARWRLPLPPGHPRAGGPPCDTARPGGVEGRGPALPLCHPFPTPLLFVFIGVGSQPFPCAQGLWHFLGARAVPDLSVAGARAGRARKAAAVRVVSRRLEGPRLGAKTSAGPSHGCSFLVLKLLQDPRTASAVGQKKLLPDLQRRRVWP